jgi:membrane protein YqaA with SNARE-associated domain
MTSAVTLFGIAMLGTVFWVASPEAAVALFASTRDWNPLAVGTVAAAGQGVALTVLFVFGHQLRRRWRWFDRQCERARARFGDRMTRNAVLVAAASGLLGVPPASVSATLAPGLAPRPRPLLPLIVATRVVRLTAVAALVIRWGLHWPPW